MSVELSPEELGFKRVYLEFNKDAHSDGYTGPFNHEVTQVLRISNPHSGPVAFKVRTIVL